MGLFPMYWSSALSGRSSLSDPDKASELEVRPFEASLSQRPILRERPVDWEIGPSFGSLVVEALNQ